MEVLIPVGLSAGFYANGTVYQAKNRWYKGHLVRWIDGALRPVGGWTAALTVAGATIQATGVPRCSLAWRKNDGTAWIGVGTHTKLAAYSNGVLSDLTPVGLVTGAQDGSASAGYSAYGAGLYGAGVYGGAGAAGTISDADTWSLDTFGEILLACLTSDGKIYSSTPTAVATQVTNSPTGCRSLVVTPERFVFALGAGGDPRLCQWPSQQTLTTWTPTAGNSAGSFPIQTSGRLMSGRRMDRETLLFTDVDLWSANYIGGPLYYSFNRRGTDCGLLGPNAVCIAGGVAYWMGNQQFFSYAGAVRSMPCDVSDRVFSDLSQAQRAKIIAVSLAAFNEVWWFYPSASQTGTENDRYVKYNTKTGTWDTGTLGRAAAVGTDVFPNPQMWASDGTLYTHENGQNRGGQTAYVESGPMELGNGERVLRIQRVVPDVASGPLQITFFAADSPLDPETTVGPYALTAETDVRLETRQPRIKLDDLGAAVDWRLGTFRVGVIPGGYR